MFGKKKLIIGAAAAAVVIVALVAVILPGLSPQPERVLRAVFGTEPVNLDPHDFRTTQDTAMMQAVYERLCALTPEGQIKGLLAESWDTPDLITWTFKLRQGVKFHDGTPFDADAVTKVYARLLDPKVVLMQKGAISPPLVKVEKVDTYTVRFILNRPFAFLPNILSYNPGFVASPKNFDMLKEFAVGTGPFKFVEWVKGNRIVMQKNPEYWGEKPWLDKIILRFAAEDTVRIAMLEAGEVDVAERVSPTDAARLKGDPKMTFVGGSTARLVYVGFNVLKKPFDDRRVRQALNYAVDKEAIVKKIMLGYTETYDCLVAKGVMHYHPTKRYEYNPELAKKLLAEAGYPNGFKCTFQVGWGRLTADKEVVEAIQSMLLAVGVEAKINGMAWATHAASLRVPPEKAQHEIFWSSWTSATAEPDWTVRRKFTKAGFPPDYNYFYYVNPTIEELVPKASSTLNFAERDELYKKIYSIVMEDAPWIYLYSDPVLFGVRKGWTNMTPQPTIESMDIRYAVFKP